MATKKITTLSPEAEALLPQYREAARAVGLATGPADRELARSAIDRAYAWVGEKPPLIVHARGPIEAVLMAAILKLEIAAWDGMPKKDPTSGQLYGQLDGQLRGQLDGQLRGQLYGQLAGQLRGQTRLGEEMLDAWSKRWCWGQCELGWVTWLAFAIDHAGVVVPTKDRDGLCIWEDLGRACYMVFSWKGLSIVVDHPATLHFDEQQRLHAIDRPALTFADGTTLYCVRGVRIDYDKGAGALAGTLEPAVIRDERNAEVRRVMIDRYDVARERGAFLRDVGAKVVHTDVDQYGRPRRLLRIDRVEDEPYVAIEVTNSSPEPDGTFKKYVLRVDPELRPLPENGRPSGRGQEPTCHNAVASLHGLRGESYAPLVET